MRKILSIILALTMVMSCMSTVVFGAEADVAKIGDTEYATFADALAEAKDGETITLIADCVNLEGTINKKVIIDLGGKTVTDAYIIVTKEVEIKNGDIVNAEEPYPLVVNKGHLTINDVDIKASKSDRAIWLRDSYSATAPSTLTFNSGSILATKGENNTKSSIAAVYTDKNTQVNINGGTITVDTPGSKAYGIYGNYENANVTMTGGKVSTSGGNYSYGIYVDGDITVSGGEIVTNEKCYGYTSGITYGYNYALYTSLGDVTVTGGKITTNGHSGYLVNAGRSYSAVDQTVNISGVEFTNNLSEIDKTKGNHKEPALIKSNSAANITANITAGTFNGTSAELVSGSNCALTVSGGTFSTAPNAKYLAEELESKQNADGSISYGEDAKSNIAKIGDTEYATLEEAFVKANDGETITLLDNATPTLISQRAITKAATIDLNGKTLTLTEDDLYFGTTIFKNGNIVVDPSVKPSTAVFWMFANQTLTFDNVKLTATGVTGTYLIGLDGNNADLNLLNSSEIIVENSTALDLDIICVNSSTGNDIVIDSSKVSVTNLDGRVFFRGNYTVSGNSDIDLKGITKAGFRIEAGQTLTIKDTATVDIEGEPRDGGIHLTDVSAIYNKEDSATVNATINRPADEKPALPTATVTELKTSELNLTSPLTFALNFLADEATDAQLEYYGDWYADYVLTVNKTVTFNSDGSADGYLAGQYDAWSENWVYVPFENVTLEANKPLKVMEYAMELMNQPGLKLTYNDVYGFVKDFDCGIYFDDEFIAANPDLEVTLELRMYNPENEEESYAIGKTYEFKAADLKPEIMKNSLYVTYAETGKWNFGSGEEDSIKLSLFGGIDSLNYSEVGFDVTIGDVTERFPVKVVYGAVKTKLNGEVVTIPASEFGRGVNYIYGYTIHFPATDEFDNTEVEWSLYAKKGGKEIPGGKFTLDDFFPGTLNQEG